MRQIFVDTETTGLSPESGDRIIEVGCVEMLNRKLTGQRFHRYINPEREVEAGAMAVHGLSSEFLQDKPKFGEIVTELLDFVQGAELVIHNAGFDIGFLNNELALSQQPPLAQCCSGVVDTLKLARELHPGRKNSLDALCERYAIDNSGRTLHGALLDAELLAEVYLAMTRGQDSLLMELDAAPACGLHAVLSDQHLPLHVLRADPQELAEHDRVLAEIDRDSKGNCLWKALLS
jgi:DNA polymerase III subunit epsilon